MIIWKKNVQIFIFFQHQRDLFFNASRCVYLIFEKNSMSHFINALKFFSFWWKSIRKQRWKLFYNCDLLRNWNSIFMHVTRNEIDNDFVFLDERKNNILNNFVIKRKIIKILLKKSIFIFVFLFILKHEKWFKFSNLSTIIIWFIDWIIFIESLTFCVCWWWWWCWQQTSSFDIAKTWRKKKSIVKISFSRFRTNFFVFFLTSIKFVENNKLIENTVSAISNFFKRMKFIEHLISCQYNSKFKHLFKKHVMILCLKKQFSHVSCCFLLIMQKTNTSSDLSKSFLKHRVQTCCVERSAIF